MAAKKMPEEAKKYRVVTSEDELDSVAMKGSLERVQVGRCTVGYTTRFVGGSRKQELYPWNVDVIGGHEDGGPYPLDSFRTLVEAFRAARRVTRAIDAMVAEPDIVEVVHRIVSRGKKS